MAPPAHRPAPPIYCRSSKKRTRQTQGFPPAWVLIPWGENGVLHAGEQLYHEAKACGCPVQQCPTAVRAGAAALDPGKQQGRECGAGITCLQGQEDQLQNSARTLVRLSHRTMKQQTKRISSDQHERMRLGNKAQHFRWKMTGSWLTIISQEQAVTAPIALQQHSSVISSIQKQTRYQFFSSARNRKQRKGSAVHLKCCCSAVPRGAGRQGMRDERAAWMGL